VRSSFFKICAEVCPKPPAYAQIASDIENEWRREEQTSHFTSWDREFSFWACGEGNYKATGYCGRE